MITIFCSSYIYDTDGRKRIDEDNRKGESKLSPFFEYLWYLFSVDIGYALLI